MAGSNGSGGPREAKARLRKLTRRYHHVAAKRNALSPYSNAEVLEMRRALKTAKRARESGSADRMLTVAADLENRIAEAKQEVGDSEIQDVD